MDHPPSPPPTRRIPGRRVLLTGLIIVLAISGFLFFRIWQGLDYEGEPPATGGAADTTLGEPVAELAQTVVYTVDPDLQGAEFNPENPVQVGNDMTAFEVIGRPGVWAVNVTWYYVKNQPLHLHTFAEMMALEQEGRIDDSTPVGFAVYRFEVKGASIAEVAEEARARCPAEVPPPLLDSLRRALAAADTVNAR